MLRNIIVNLAVAALALVLLTGQAPAGVIWDAGGGVATNVDTNTNWDNDTSPDLTGGTSDLQFGSGGSAANINIAVNVNSLTFTRNANFSLERGDPPGHLTIGAGGLIGDNVGTTARTYTVKQHVTANGAQTWETKDQFSKISVTGDVLLSGGDLTLKTFDSSGSTITFSGEFAGSQAVNVVGRVVFSWPATYTGDTTIGTIGNVAQTVANALPFGTGKGNVIMDNNNNVSNDAGVLGLGGFDLSINGLSGAGGTQPARVLNNNTSGSTTQMLTVGNNDATATFNGIILDRTSGSRKLSLTKVGGGTQTLAGESTYTGGTTISGGTLYAANTAGSATGTGNVTVGNTGTFAGIGFASSAVNVENGGTLAGTLTLSGPVTVADGGNIAPGTSAGTLTINTTLTLNSSSALAFDLIRQNLPSQTIGGGVNDLITGVTHLTLDGSLSVADLNPGSFLSAVAGDRWRLINYTGNLTDNGLSIGTMPALSSGLSYMIDTSTIGNVDLLISVVPEASALILPACAMLLLVAQSLVRANHRSSGAFRLPAGESKG